MICLGVTSAVLLFAGCQMLPEPRADATRNYVLSGPVAAEGVSAKVSGRYQIGLRAIEIPGYLHNRRDMAVRTAANEVRFDEFARWAESLESGVGRVLKQRLLAAEGVGGVSTPPFSTDLKRDYDLVVRIQSCEGAVVEGHTVVRFVASYDVIAAGAGGQTILRRTFSAPEQTWNGRDFGALAGLLSEAVARLGDDIVANLPK